MRDLFIVNELDTWSRELNTEFSLGDCIFGAVKLTKNCSPDKYEHGGYDIGYDALWQSLSSPGD